MLDSVVRDVQNTIDKYKMLEPGDKVVIGVSGGPDSLCLLHVLKRLSGEYGITLYAAHLNHRFRGKAADGDAEFVDKICKAWGIRAFIETFDVPAYAKQAGMSPEEAGREIRYKLFDRICREVGGNRIAVAQNMNDQVETVLMRLMRGSGIDGLKGIEPVRGNIVRPLMEIDRERVEAYCQAADLVPRVDLTNLEPVYLRNKIRLELLPYMKKNFNPNIMTTLTRFANIVKEENDYLEMQAEDAFRDVAACEGDRICYEISKLIGQHTALQRRLVRIGIEKLLKGLQNIEFKHIEAILALPGKPTGAAVMLPHRLKAYMSYESLILTKDIEKADKKCYYKLKYDYNNRIMVENAVFIIERRERDSINGIERNKHIAFIDEAKIKSGLALRSRKEGDVFSPIGMKGSKKLKAYFIDEKIPKEERDAVELIADGNEIVWVIGKRLSEKYKITNDTQHIIMIKRVGRTYNGEGYTGDNDQ